VAGALLVAHKDVLDRILLVQFVVDRQNRSAGISEDMLDAIVLERLQNHFRACHFHLLAGHFA
jgi:hypothetical protein